MKEQVQHNFKSLIAQLIELDTTHVLYVMLLVCVVIVLDDVLRVIHAKSKSSGLEPIHALAINIDGAKKHKAKTYISEIQGISGRPDAVILENGFYIPVERKPIGNKIRDRHIAQLLVYMRLVEEFEGKKPPYGYLILGKNSRKVKIYNSRERQAWLSNKLLNMRAIVEQGVTPEPIPHPKKCQRCKVQDRCERRFELMGDDHSKELVVISS